MIRFTVNGETVEHTGNPDMPLLWFVRDVMSLTGTKFGCGQGLCGACTVHMDGAAIRSCITPVESVAEASITTIEGLGADGDHRLQAAWVRHNVPQCGYCQPGQIMQAAAMLNDVPNPSDEDIDTYMSGNICRCGTYSRIRAAIKDAASNTGAE